MINIQIATTAHDCMMENVDSVVGRNTTDKYTTRKTKFTLPLDNDTIEDLDECDEALRGPMKMLRSPFQEKERQEPECAKDNENKKSITGSSNLNETQKASVALHQAIKSPAANSTFWHESDNNTTTSPYFGDQLLGLFSASNHRTEVMIPSNRQTLWRCLNTRPTFVHAQLL